MRKIAMLFTALLLCFSFSFAQTRSVSGVVSDEAGNPLAGVSVQIKGTRIGTTTTGDGHYTLNITSAAKFLEFSHLGYESQSVAIGSGNNYSVTLMAASGESLDEIVLTGYGTEKRTQFAGAATVLSAKIVDDAPVGSFTQALQGRAPGLLVNSGSGQPGANATMTIRGIKSISGAGAQPLYVIDGVPVSSGSLQTLNPEDFESLTVLKDASAAALYGARGATGVIVIETKKGKEGPTVYLTS